MSKFTDDYKALVDIKKEYHTLRDSVFHKVESSLELMKKNGVDTDYNNHDFEYIDEVEIIDNSIVSVELKIQNDYDGDSYTKYESYPLAIIENPTKEAIESYILEEKKKRQEESDRLKASVKRYTELTEQQKEIEEKAEYERLKQKYERN